MGDEMSGVPADGVTVSLFDLSWDALNPEQQKSAFDSALAAAADCLARLNRAHNEADKYQLRALNAEQEVERLRAAGERLLNQLGWFTNREGFVDDMRTAGHPDAHMIARWRLDNWQERHPKPEEGT